jgi:hypothetical protein
MKAFYFYLPCAEKDVARLRDPTYDKLSLVVLHGKLTSKSQLLFLVVKVRVVDCLCKSKFVIY